MKILAGVVPIILQALIAAGYCYADPKLPPLKEGMAVSDVLGSWGQPLERIEHEVKREVTWVYKGGQVTFKDEKVVKWHLDGLTQESQAVQSVKGTASVPNNGDVKEKAGVEVDQLLAQLAKELPDNENTGTAPNQKSLPRLPALQPGVAPIDP